MDEKSGPLKMLRTKDWLKLKAQDSTFSILISMGPIVHLGVTEMLRREIERLQSHLGDTEIPIGETDLPRFCGSGYDI